MSDYPVESVHPIHTSQHVLSTTDDTIITTSNGHSQQLLQPIPSPSLYTYPVQPSNEDIAKSSPSSYSLSDQGITPHILPRIATKRSYQQLPQLSIPPEPLLKLSSQPLVRNFQYERRNDRAGVQGATYTYSPETPSSTSTSETLVSSSTPQTPVSLGSPIVGVVDLTPNMTTTSSGPVSHGGCSDIYRGELDVRRPDGDGKEKVQVAIKLLRALSYKGYDEDKARKRLNREVYVWHRLDHPNIVTFLGTSYHMANRPSLILPWFINGSASDYLRLRNPGADRLRLILDVAEGLKYLHTCKPAPIVHGDLKGNNILITDDGRAALSDFGLSQVIGDLVGPTGITPSTQAGPIRWQSPEIVMDVSETSRPQLPGDVWSFGCTAYELLTGKVPYHFRLREATVIHDIQTGVLPPGAEENNANRGDSGIWDLLNDCWISSPEERIQMTEVVCRLGGFCSSSLTSTGCQA